MWTVTWRTGVHSYSVSDQAIMYLVLRGRLLPFLRSNSREGVELSFQSLAGTEKSTRLTRLPLCCPNSKRGGVWLTRLSCTDRVWIVEVKLHDWKGCFKVVEQSGWNYSLVVTTKGMYTSCIHVLYWLVISLIRWRLFKLIDPSSKP